MLSNKLIAAATAGSTLWDTVVPGLHLRAFPHRKSYYHYFRTKAGRERRPKIGDHGLITLEQARQIARAHLAVVAGGGDPILDRQAAREALTVAKLCERYVREHASRKKSKAQDEYLIKAYIKATLAAKRVNEVTYDDIANLHRTFAGRPYLGNRVLALLSKMFNLAEKWRLRPEYSNPCRHVSRYPEAKRRRYMRPDEAPAIAAALAKYEAGHAQAVAFIYLLILSGARPKEIATARHEWLEKHDRGATLRLPDSKTGARPVYLPPQVVALLERLPRVANGTLTGIASPRALWDRVRADVKTDLRLYDLRHTFASAALKAGYSLAQIGELLGHASTQTTHRYAHLIDEEAQEAAAVTANLLEEMMRPKVKA